MIDLVKGIAQSLVENKDAVIVTSRVEDQTTIIMLKVAPEDMGKIIGKKGRIAKAIRTVVKSAATKANEKVIVEIVE